MGKLEKTFQKEVIDEVKQRLPGCIVLKNDAGYIQGFPDLTVHYGSKYAYLECKKDRNATHQANQDYYINKANEDGAYAAFIFPENKEDSLNELQQALQS